jgi:hypothetical protein
MNRVVLGNYEGNEAGYIGEARRHGGIYYDPSPQAFDAMTYGLSDEDANQLCWQVVESFLRTQLERAPARFDYVLNRAHSSSVEEVVALDPHSLSAKEITFLKLNAESYGYQQLGTSWLQVRIIRK